ncbi:CoA-binding protein [Demequina sp. B12]|uniref:CoA-binding protein n=1 Tax=Demequina sp. B12 TaxID=2992757 RepID=UPI00237C013E|nr:CoA-binding protein [Demequina sp. B12]MDE0573511.1 CoA-binding protein [Demequina sp. B12]
MNASNAIPPIEPVAFDGEACPAPTGGQLPDDTALATALGQARTVAVVGASPNDQRTSYAIAVWLMENTPYQVFLVNPMAVGDEIRGHAFYASLADLPVVPDIVDVFRRSEHVPEVADEAVAVGSRMLWMQLGVVNEEAASQARSAGMSVVQNHCIKVEYARLRTEIEEHAAA